MLRQTYRSFEIIAVDDGSTDDTIEILDAFGTKIRKYRKENGGPASARNYGIQRARGRFIALLDHDDLWLEDKLMKQAPILSNDPEIGMVFSNALYLKDGSYLDRTFFDHVKPHRGKVFKNLFQRNFVPNLTTLTRKECFEKLGYFDQTGRMLTTDDYDMWLRIAANYQIDYIDEPLAVFRMHEKNFSNDVDLFCGNIINTLTENMSRFPEESERLGFLKKKRFAELYYKISRNHYNQNDYRTASITIGRSLKFHPGHMKSILLGLLIKIRSLRTRSPKSSN